MAAAAVQTPIIASTPQVHQTERSTPNRDVRTILNYYKPNEDGSPPHPTYIDRPETYNQPFEPHDITVRDIAGEEDKYTLDRNGFQVHRHVATEKDFLDEAQIKSNYYAETEQLLKDVYVLPSTPSTQANIQQHRSFQSLHIRPHHPPRTAQLKRHTPRPSSTRAHRPVLLGGAVPRASPPPRPGGPSAQGPRADYQCLAADQEN